MSERFPKNVKSVCSNYLHRVGRYATSVDACQRVKLPAALEIVFATYGRCQSLQHRM